MCKNLFKFLLSSVRMSVKFVRRTLKKSPPMKHHPVDPKFDTAWEAATKGYKAACAETEPARRAMVRDKMRELDRLRRRSLEIGATKLVD